jgi:photosystem II stability/assembly factor-like uncharacterized protein
MSHRKDGGTGTRWAGRCCSRRVVLASLGGLAVLVAGCQSVSPGLFNQIAAEPGAPASWLAVDVTDGTLLEVGGGLFRSSDRGQNWEKLAAPADLHPDKLQIVATTAAAPSRLYAAGPGAGVVRSDDRGQTWRAIGASLPGQDVTSFAIHSFRPDTLYAGIAGQGVFRTEDSGALWQRMDDWPPARVVGLAHSTLDGSMNTGWLYAATPDGPYLSMDCF